MDASLSCNATSIGLYESSRRWEEGKQGGKFADRTRRGETGCVATVRLHGGTRHVPCTGIHSGFDTIALDYFSKTEENGNARTLFFRISKFEAIIYNTSIIAG